MSDNLVESIEEYVAPNDGENNDYLEDGGDDGDYWKQFIDWVKYELIYKLFKHAYF